MVGGPQLQMTFGLGLGSFLGCLFAWSIHPLWCIVGLPAGAIAGFVYVALICLICGWCNDIAEKAFKNQNLIGGIGFALLSLAFMLVAGFGPLIGIRSLLVAKSHAGYHSTPMHLFNSDGIDN